MHPDYCKLAAIQGVSRLQPLGRDPDCKLGTCVLQVWVDASSGSEEHPVSQRKG